MIDDMPGDHPQLVLLLRRLKRVNESRNPGVEQHNYYQGETYLRLEKEIRYLSASTNILNIQCYGILLGVLDVALGLWRWFLYQYDILNLIYM